ncbi:uncharacterized protein LOC126550031 [Aphis gossypii]|uniref:uncharacterized protein LOC126550031 n=1 Tax=Aphis gossypii TaxID=80765 RepID=UPI002158C74A|nr:uncharacterized protein LOC126550031 [Aphis gossypii]
MERRIKKYMPKDFRSIEINALKAGIKHLNYKEDSEKGLNKIVDRTKKYRKNGYGNSSAGKIDDVKMKHANATKKCGQGSSTAGNDVKKQSNRMRSDAVKMDCHLFKTEIPNALAELITAMNGCLSQYICKTAKIQKMTVSFCFGKSNSQKLFIYGSENGMRYAMKLLKKILSKMVREFSVK